MELSQIQTFLDSPNPQSRMKAITELRHYEPDVVVPLLKQRMNDSQFVIRSFVAMGLGYKRNSEGFEALLEILQSETDANVIAEAANSLAKFGMQALPHLKQLFQQYDHWLIRQSIFAVIADFDRPDVLLELCQIGFQGEDVTVRQVAIALLKYLQATPFAPGGLEILLQAAQDSDALVRAEAAKSLRGYPMPVAQAALATLRQDPDHRVIGATLEGLV